MKIYTRTGDKGETSLVGGARVAKNHPRVDCYGDIDELNSCVGLAAAFVQDAELIRWLETVQRDLFALGSWLASPEASERVAQGKAAFSGKREERTKIDDARIKELEAAIDTWEKDLPTMKAFILPGGSQAGATLHLARTVCRRAERAAVGLQRNGEIVPEIAVCYLNRLADALFVLARFVNLQERNPETPWT